MSTVELVAPVVSMKQVFPGLIVLHDLVPDSPLNQSAAYAAEAMARTSRTAIKVYFFMVCSFRLKLVAIFRVGPTS